MGRLAKPATVEWLSSAGQRVQTRDVRPPAPKRGRGASNQDVGHLPGVGNEKPQIPRRLFLQGTAVEERESGPHLPVIKTQRDIRPGPIDLRQTRQERQREMVLAVLSTQTDDLVHRRDVAPADGAAQGGQHHLDQAIVTKEQIIEPCPRILAFDVRQPPEVCRRHLTKQMGRAPVRPQGILARAHVIDPRLAATPVLFASALPATDVLPATGTGSVQMADAQFRERIGQNRMSVSMLDQNVHRQAVVALLSAHGVESTFQ